MDEIVSKWISDNYGKKIIVIYGNCHTTAIRHILNQVDILNEQYSIFPFKAIQDVKNPGYFNNGIIQNCDVFIHQVIRDNNKYGIEWSSNEILKKIKPTCQVIGIPNVYHLPMCFFPQYIEKKDFCGRNKNTFFFRDDILDLAYLNRWSIAKTIDYYNYGDFMDVVSIKQSFDKFIDKVINRENDWDIKISNFILENYKEKKLFYDPNHPTPIFIREIAYKLLKYMDLSVSYEIMDQFDDFPLDSFEMPLCGCVKKSLELTFYEDEIRKNGIKRVRGEMDLKEYIKEYWSYEWQNDELSLVRRSAEMINYLSASIARRM